MPVVLEGSLGGGSVRYRPIPLVGLCLRSARRSTEAALAVPVVNKKLEERIELAILAVVWSALALEAGANQFAEDVLPKNNLDDFMWCRKSFSKPPRVSQTVWKWHKLFIEGPKVDISLSDPLFVAAEYLVQARNRLSHYRLKDTSQKIYYPPVHVPEAQDGKLYFVSFDVWRADMEPDKVEPSLVEKELLADKPKEHFGAAWNVFHKWELSNRRDGSELEKAIPPL